MHIEVDAYLQTPTHVFSVIFNATLVKSPPSPLAKIMTWTECGEITRFYCIVKNYIVWPTFLLQKVSVYLQPLLRNPPKKLPNSVKLRSR